MTLDDLTNALFSSGKPGQQPASNGLLGLFDQNNPQQQLAQRLMAAGGPNYLQGSQVPHMPQGGGGSRGPFPFFAPPINTMPVQPQIPNFAALLQAIRQSQPAPFSLAPQQQNLFG